MEIVYYRKTAKEIVERIVENTVRSQYARNSLQSFEDCPSEDEMVLDAIALALGDDTGCLGIEDFTAEFIDVLFVEQKILDAEQAAIQACALGQISVEGLARLTALLRQSHSIIHPLLHEVIRMANGTQDAALVQAVTDLSNAFTSNQSAVQAEVAALQASPVADDPAVATAITNLTALTASVNAATAAATAAIAPPAGS